mgnify:CR=1 FL=1
MVNQVPTEADYDVAVPGESLTGELGNKPYEQPPQMPTVEENVNFYMEQILSPQIMPQIAANLERGRRVSDFAEFLVTSGVASGRHTIDVGILVLPVVMETVALVGDMYKVEYDMGLTTGSEESEDHFVDLAMSQLQKEEEDMEPEYEDVMGLDIEEEEEPMMDETMEQPQQEQQPAGLMTRR